MGGSSATLPCCIHNPSRPGGSGMHPHLYSPTSPSVFKISRTICRPPGRSTGCPGAAALLLAAAVLLMPHLPLLGLLPRSMLPPCLLPLASAVAPAAVALHAACRARQPGCWLVQSERVLPPGPPPGPCPSPLSSTPGCSLVLGLGPLPAELVLALPLDRLWPGCTAVLPGGAAVREAPAVLLLAWGPAPPMSAPCTICRCDTTSIGTCVHVSTRAVSRAREARALANSVSSASLPQACNASSRRKASASARPPAPHRDKLRGQRCARPAHEVGGACGAATTPEVGLTTSASHTTRLLLGRWSLHALPTCLH